MADSQQSKAFGWLAFSSALLVLLASGVAISRLGDDDGDNRVASAPTTAPDSLGGTGPDGGGGSEDGAGASDAKAATDSAGGTTASAPTARTAGGTSTGGRHTSGEATPGTAGGTSGGTSSADGTGTASPTGALPSGGGQADQPDSGTGQPDGAPGGAGDGGPQPGQSDGSPGGEDSPPGPSGQPPEQDSRLVAASASAGEGAQGGVVAVAVDGTDLDVDLTLGRDQLVGNHPPSDGTGVSFGGRLLNPPSASPAFPTLSG